MTDLENSIAQVLAKSRAGGLMKKPLVLLFAICLGAGWDLVGYLGHVALNLPADPWEQVAIQTLGLLVVIVAWPTASERP